MPQYDFDGGIVNNISNGTSFSMSEVWIIISVLLAVIGGLFFYTTYINKENKNEGYKKVIYDFLNFKLTIIEPIFKTMYIIVAIAITLSSFTYITTNFFMFISIIVFGNILARISFELLLLTLKLFKDVSEINLNLQKKDIKKKTEPKKEEIKND